MRSKAFFLSLLVTIALSFTVPLLLIGVAITSLSLGTHVPPLGAVSQMSAEQIIKFLAVFGNGDAIEGALVIGITCSLVGVMFDTYAYYNRLRNG